MPAHNTRLRLRTFRGKSLSEEIGQAIQEEVKKDLREWGNKKVKGHFDAIVKGFWNDKNKPQFRIDARTLPAKGGVSFGLIVEGTQWQKWLWNMLDEKGRKGGTIIKPKKMVAVYPIQLTKTGRAKRRRVGLRLRKYNPITYPGQRGNYAAMGKMGIPPRQAAYAPITPNQTYAYHASLPVRANRAKGIYTSQGNTPYPGSRYGPWLTSPYKKVKQVRQGAVIPRKFTESYLQDKFVDDFYKVAKRAYDRVAKRYSRR